MNIKKTVVALMFVFSIIMSSLHIQASTNTTNQACTSNLDCSSGACDTNGTCSSCQTSNINTEYYECTYDGDCCSYPNNTASCVYGVCSCPEPGCMCGGDTDCTNNLCVNNYCSTAPLNGGACTADSQCGSNYCDTKTGKCMACTSTSCSTSSYTCENINGTITCSLFTSSSSTTSAPPTCSNNSNTSGYCVAAISTTPTTFTCAEDDASVCSSGSCVNGYCTTCQTNELNNEQNGWGCQQDGNCCDSPYSSYCLITQGQTTGVCSCYNNGCQCNQNSDCASNTCISNYCTACSATSCTQTGYTICNSVNGTCATAPNECNENSQCSSNECILNATTNSYNCSGCQNAGFICSTDSQCCSQMCSSTTGLCTGLATGDSCTQAGECDTNICSNGECSCLQPGASCSNYYECCNQSCTDNICTCASNGCSCNVDNPSQCDSGCCIQSGTSSTCQDPLANGSTCAYDSQCISDVCDTTTLTCIACTTTGCACTTNAECDSGVCYLDPTGTSTIATCLAEPLSGGASCQNYGQCMSMNCLWNVCVDPSSTILEYINFQIDEYYVTPNSSIIVDFYNNGSVVGEIEFSTANDNVVPATSAYAIGTSTPLPSDTVIDYMTMQQSGFDTTYLIAIASDNGYYIIQGPSTNTGELSYWYSEIPEQDLYLPTLSDGSACGSNAECTSTVCDTTTWTCIACTTGGCACTTNTECDSGACYTDCNNSSSSPTCLANLLGGGSCCQNDAQCMSGNCSNALCTNPVSTTANQVNFQLLTATSQDQGQFEVIINIYNSTSELVGQLSIPTFSTAIFNGTQAVMPNNPDVTLSADTSVSYFTMQETEYNTVYPIAFEANVDNQLYIIDGTTDGTGQLWLYNSAPSTLPS